MRLLLSYILYFIGDIISITLMSYGFGFKIYNKVMLWSVDLDNEGKISFCNIITPTAQNLNMMEEDISDYVEILLKKGAKTENYTTSDNRIIIINELTRNSSIKNILNNPPESNSLFSRFFERFKRNKLKSK